MRAGADSWYHWLFLLALAASLGASKPLELTTRSDGTVTGVGGRYALVIGVNDYTQAGLGTLKYSEDDARAMRDTLVQYGGFPADNVTVFTGPKATQQNILLYLDNLASRPEAFPGADTFVLYFSGHGGVIDSRSGGANSSGQRGQFLIPYDGSNQVALAEFKNVALDKITQYLDASPFQRKVVLLDACRNVLRTGSMAGASATSGFDLSQYSAATGLKIMTGTKLGEISWEDPALGHGVFTNYLLAGLRGGAAQTDGVVTVASLESFVSAGLSAYSRNNPDKAQTPQTSGEGLSGIALTVPPPGGAPALPVPRRKPVFVKPVMEEYPARQVTPVTSTALQKAEDDVAAKPDDSGAHYALAVAYHSLGREDDALTQYQQYLGLYSKPGFIEYRDLALFCFDAGKYQLTVDYALRGIKVNGGY